MGDRRFRCPPEKSKKQSEVINPVERLKTPPFTSLNFSNLENQSASSSSSMSRNRRTRKAAANDQDDVNLNGKRAKPTFVPVFSQSSNTSMERSSSITATPSQPSSMERSSLTTSQQSSMERSSSIAATPSQQSSISSPLPDVTNGPNDVKASTQRRSQPKSETTPPEFPSLPSTRAPSVAETDAKPEASTVSFEIPSSSWFKGACQKLGVEHNRQLVSGLWDKMGANITSISSKSKPLGLEIVKPGKESGFLAIAQMLSGTFSPEIKKAIGIYFLRNYKSLGNCLGKDFSTMPEEEAQVLAFSDSLVPEFCEMISRWLGCRIGVFDGDALRKYGNWNDGGEDMATLLLKLDGENYQIITSLYDQP